MIPATSNAKHAYDNFQSGSYNIPDYNLSRKMVNHLNLIGPI